MDIDWLLLLVNYDMTILVDRIPNNDGRSMVNIYCPMNKALLSREHTGSEVKGQVSFL